MRRSFQTVSLQRQSKALTRMRSWSRCERSLLSTPGIAGRFNRYDKRCRRGILGSPYPETCIAPVLTP
jgi:hypothetical protein